MKSKNISAAIFSAAVISGFVVNSFACGPDFPNSLLAGGDKALLQPPFADFQHELERIKLVKPSVRAVPPEEGESYRDQAVTAEMADLAEALKRSGISTAQAAAILSEHLHQRVKLKEAQTRRLAWRASLNRWKMDFRQASRHWLDVSTPDPTEINARLREVYLKALPSFVPLVGTERQSRECEARAASMYPRVIAPAGLVNNSPVPPVVVEPPLVELPGEPDLEGVWEPIEIRQKEHLGLTTERGPDSQAVEEWTRTNPPPAISEVQVTPGLPREFACYFRGAIAKVDGDEYRARQEWERLLALPEKERHYKSTWAAFMLGQLGEPEETAAAETEASSYVCAQAVSHFRQVRELVRGGFADSTGLAAASLGLEARICLAQKNYADAIELYLEQYAAGDSSAVNSLRFTAIAAFGESGASPEQFVMLAKNTRARRVLTAYLISYRLPLVFKDDAEGWNLGLRDKSPGGTVSVWLDAVEAAEIKEVEFASQFALAAYQAGRMDLAQRWVSRAGNDPTAQWLQAKLFLRAGKADAAAKLLAQLSRRFPQNFAGTNRSVALAANLTLPDRYVGLDEHELISAGQQVLGELGVLRLARREYAEALDALLRSTYWMDAAYVAERVLTTDELKNYVDRNWPPVSASRKEPLYDDHFSYGDRKQTLREKIRYLLARRLARDARYAEARDYFPRAWLASFDALVAALKTGRDQSILPAKRVEALLSAALITRTNGMELAGTELAPDWFIEDGNFEYGVTWQERQENNVAAEVNVASPDEIKRAQSHRADPEERWHYRDRAQRLRIEAAGVCWDAAQLTPDNSDETARSLIQGGQIMSRYDPEAADRYYKALVKRCGKTVYGQQADKLRWFPDLDEQGNILNLIPWIDQVEPTAELVDTIYFNNAGGAYSKFPVPGRNYRVQPGDTLIRIARAASKLGEPLTVQQILEANPGVNPAKLRVGKLLAIPGAVTRPPPKRFSSEASQPDSLPDHFSVNQGRYVVHSGDTFLGICQAACRSGWPLTPQQLMAANPGVDTKRLKVGQVLNIPAPVLEPAATTTTNVATTASRPLEQSVNYVVRSGDTILAIAKNFHVTVRTLMNANQLPNLKLRVGQVLVIPAPDHESNANSVPDADVNH